MPRVYVAFPRQVDRAVLANRCRAIAGAGHVPFAWQLAWPWELANPSPNFELRIMSAMHACDRVLFADGGLPLDDTMRAALKSAAMLGKPLEFVA